MLDIVRSKMRVRNFRIIRNESGSKFKVQSSGMLHSWKTVVDRQYSSADGSIETIEKAREFKTTLIEKEKEKSWQTIGDREVE